MSLEQYAFTKIEYFPFYGDNHLYQKRVKTLLGIAMSPWTICISQK